MTSPKTVFILIRYSVLSQSKFWQIARDGDFDAYKRKLFSPQRLDAKWQLFSELTMKSLDELVANSQGVKVCALLMTSDELPQEHRARLDTAVDKRPWMHVVELTRKQSIAAISCRWITSYLQRQAVDCDFASVRLDDDDMLAGGYIAALQRYVNADFAGAVVTFPRGYEPYWDASKGGISDALLIDYPKVAVGLAFISRYLHSDATFLTEKVSIFQTGNHVRVDEQYPLIADHSLIAYVKMAHAQQDTGDNGVFEARQRKNPAAQLEQLATDFPAIAAFLEQPCYEHA